MADAHGGIVLDGIRHAYATSAEPLVILNGISLKIDEGQFVALIGPSGCGKTTILDIMSGLLAHQQGSVEIGGRPPAEGRRDTARMFARDALLPWRTAFSNIDFALSTRRSDPQRGDLVRSLLKDVGLERFENAYPRQLSQGMRQRVALARTFSLEADYLFLDEPFGALDAQTKLMLQDKLVPLHKSLFLENNPGGIKYAASKLGLCSNEFRLPVVPITEANEKAIDSAMAYAGLLN